MNSVAEFLGRSSDRNGFRRDRYEEKRIPTDFSNVCVMPFFGDMRSISVVSSYLIQRYREESRGSKYFVFASWPGFQGLFPYVDEYWSLTDESILKKFYERSEGVRNKSDLNTSYIRNLNEFFRDVIDHNEIQKYYNNGFTNYFFNRFNDTKRFLPFVPSSTIIGKDFNKNLITKAGYKVFLHPSIFCKFWHNGISDNLKAKREFYIELVKFLANRNITCVLWNNFLSYDLSEELDGIAIILREPDVVKALAAMRSCNCVLDLFSGVSRFAYQARSPFLCFDERSRYSGTKEHEIDSLSSCNVPHEYIFSFSTIITDGDVGLWKSDIFQNLAKRLEEFVPSLNRDELPSTAESTELVPYQENVFTQKKKKMGTRFIKVPREI